MKTEIEEFVRLNGTTKDKKEKDRNEEIKKIRGIRCILIAGEYFKGIVNYSYSFGQIIINVQQEYIEDYRRILEKSSICQFMINIDIGKATIKIKLPCNFIEIKERYIYVQASEIFFTDEKGKSGKKNLARK